MNEPELLIREAQPEDAAAIVSIFNPIIASGLYTVFDTPFTIEEERRYIEQFSARGVFHVAVCLTDQQVVGFQSLEPFATYTRAFDHVGVIGTYVDLARRRQGIASALFAASFEAARRKGYEKLFTYVRGDNPAALATYLRQGFQIVGEAKRQARIGGKYINEIIIEKFLSRGLAAPRPRQ
jgi:L-amino acid N-acyltransferase YncA